MNTANYFLMISHQLWYHPSPPICDNFGCGGMARIVLCLRKPWPICQLTKSIRCQCQFFHYNSRPNLQGSTASESCFNGWAVKFLPSHQVPHFPEISKQGCSQHTFITNSPMSRDDKISATIFTHSESGIIRSYCPAMSKSCNTQTVGKNGRKSNKENVSLQEQAEDLTITM